MIGKPPKFRGISKEVQELLEADMDEAPARRRAREAFKDVQLSIDFCLFKVLLLTSGTPSQKHVKSNLILIGVSEWTF